MTVVRTLCLCSKEKFVTTVRVSMYKVTIPTTASPSNIEPIPIIASSSQPQKTHKRRKTKRPTEISQSSRPTTLVADETVHVERGDSIERAATTAASLDAEQDSGTIIRTQSMAHLMSLFLRELVQVVVSGAKIPYWETYLLKLAIMEAYYELAQRLQAEERGELTIEERSRLFVKLMNKRKKHFAKLRAEKIRRKPPTKAQKRNQMSTYLRNMAGYKHTQLKNKSFEEIQMLFDNEMKRVNSFVPMDSEVVEGSGKKTKSSRKETVSKKRAGEELDEEVSRGKNLEDDAVN
ncbi:hypothetical protein Tco_0221828 [Tanacetum coccineum]